MPELPEVETVRRGLESAAKGRIFSRVDVRRPDLRWPLPERMAERLVGARVEGISRLGKYMLCELSTGETLLLHLGMSGRFAITPAGKGGDPPGRDPHDHVLFQLDDGTWISYNDQRRFGFMDLFATGEEASHRLLERLGPEPLGPGFGGKQMRAALQRRKCSVKAVLLDQQVVAGIGNIYACEALWRARLSPLRAANTVAPSEAWRLARAVKKVLADAIAAGGSSLRDHRSPEGELGYFQHQFKVYDRYRKPCLRPKCEGKVFRSTQSGRSTFHCRFCQV